MITHHLRNSLLATSRKMLNWPPRSMSFGDKIRIIALYARARTPANFVESGTLHGSTLIAVRDEFVALHSIELDESLYKAAAAKFKEDDKVSIYQDDSGSVLKDVIATIRGPVVFWLDGHYSGSGTAKGPEDCPLWRELDAIITRGNPADVVLVDDARLYGCRQSYPTLAAINTKLQVAFPNSTFILHNDIACFLLGTL